MCEHAAALRAAEVIARVLGRSTVTCTCGFTRTVTTRAADSLANNHTGPVPALPMGRFTPTAHNLKADEYDGVPVIELDGDQVVAITDDINQALHAITHYGNDHDWAHINITADRLRSEWVAFEWQPEGSECEWLTLDAAPGDDMAVHTYRLPY